MLRSFRVENHKSIRDEQELLLLPGYDKTKPVVPVAGIFGANASGKSNLIDALRWMRDAVLNSFAAWRPGTGVPRTPFRLDTQSQSQPSGYAVDLLLDGIRYGYGLLVDDRRVREEWLYTYPHGRRRVIFERDGDTVRLGSTVTDYRSRGDVLAGLTRPDTLLLAVAAHTNQSEMRPVYDWFRGGLHLVAGPDPGHLESLFRRLEPSAPGRAGIVDLIRKADLGIVDVEVDYEADEEAVERARRLLAAAYQRRSEAPEMSATSLAQSADSECECDQPGRKTGASPLESWLAFTAGPQWSPAAFDRTLSAGGQRPTLVFRHGPRLASFELADESAGTRTWLSLLSATLDVIDRGAVLVVDELDLSLHPLLTAPLVNLFRDQQVNPHGAQLVFSTHDTTLLGEQTLARDEVWFVEKKPDTGATKIYPLTDFHPRKSENIEGRYLAGGYGGVPNVSEHTFLQALRRLRADDEAA